MILLNNRYQVLRVLGSGRFWETFLAADTQMPSSRRCVIKQLKPVANNPQIHQLVQQRFQQEAAILQDLGDRSDQIPRLYAYFVDNGEFYLVQEYIEGRTLAQVVQQQGVISESAVKEILINILPVLEYVHKKHIVHRDINPYNIILRFYDGKPVLIDFGVAMIITALNNSDRTIVIGTPGFMPMEQSVGRSVFSSDLYSLGLTAIYLLTGKLPSEFATDPATGDMLWRNHAGNVSLAFAEVLDKAIQQSPRDRYFSAREMLEASQISSITITGIPPTTLPSPPHPTQAYTAYPYSYYLLGMRLRSWLLIGGSSTQKNIWEIGKRLIPLACGGAFLGGVIAQLPGAIIGVVFGGVFGCFTTKNRRNTSSSRNTKPNVWRRGNQVITLASGGAFIGGLTAQIPGAILGSVIGALFGWFTRTQTNH